MVNLKMIKWKVTALFSSNIPSKMFATNFSGEQNYYFGEMQKNLKNGKGFVYLVNGDRYDGDFKNNKKEGVFILTKGSGKICHLEYRNDKLFKML